MEERTKTEAEQLVELELMVSMPTAYFLTYVSKLQR
jgi:hypothetical protein